MNYTVLMSSALSLLILGENPSYAEPNPWYTTKATAFAAAKAAGKQRIFLVVGNANCGECSNTRFYWCESTSLYPGVDGQQYSPKGLIESHYVLWYCDEYGPYYSESAPYYAQMPPPISSFLPHTWIIDVNTTNALDVAGSEQYPNMLVTRLSTWIPPVRTFTAWTLNEEIPVELRGINDCPAGDGIPNLLKYGCGLTAMDYCAPDTLMQSTVTNGGLQVVYFKSTNTVNVQVAPVWSGSPSSPSWSTAGLAEVYLGDQAGRQKWTATLPFSSASQAYVRLRATQP